jgi:3'-phosphoadenosine 5'-phosphosulfate sulfotransferase (PAPS reductase)/FAD synthetase
MPTIAEQILTETEYQEKPENGITGNGRGGKGPKKPENGKPGDPNFSDKTGNGISALSAKLEEKAEAAIAQIITACNQHTSPGARAAVAFSGGSDSLVLLDLVMAAAHELSDSCLRLKRFYVIWIDTQMEHPGTREFIQAIAEHYGFDLRIAKAQHTPQEQWRRTGFPMLGKMAARTWMQQNRGQGFAINVSECCRAMKIQPARRLTRNLGCGLQFTGQRGASDDSLRGLRKLKDGVLFYQARDKIYICNPLTGWTDEEIRLYIHEQGLEQHPARSQGAKTIGCMYCGGGSQYTNSGIRVLRFVNRAAWKTLIINYSMGPIILALKYKVSLYHIQEAIEEAGGLSYLINTHPWVFDFTRKTPLKGYNK